METIGQRIVRRRLELGLSKTDIWQGAGLSSGVYSQWMNGAKLSGDNLLKVAKILLVSPEWLLTGKGDKYDKIGLTLHSFKKEEKGLITISQYEEVGGSMGTGVLFQDQPGQITAWEVTQEWLNKNIPAHTGANHLCIITGFGDSMKGMFNPGDPLVIDTGIKDCKHDGVYFFRIGDEGFIKTLQRIPGQGIRVISENKKYESWTIKPDMDFQVLGKVLKVWESTEF